MNIDSIFKISTYYLLILSDSKLLLLKYKEMPWKTIHELYKIKYYVSDRRVVR